VDAIGADDDVGMIAARAVLDHHATVFVAHVAQRIAGGAVQVAAALTVAILAVQ
jgi:hypothetical protein